MSNDVEITEFSDPREMTIDAPPETAVPQFKIVKGNPSDEDIAALVCLLAGGGAVAGETGPQELNRWGLPVDKLRYSVHSWQHVTLVERTHMRR